MHLQRVYEVFDRIFLLKHIYYCLDVKSLIQYIKTNKMIYYHKRIIYNLIMQYVYFYNTDLKRYHNYSLFNIISSKTMYGEIEDADTIKKKIEQNHYLQNKKYKDLMFHPI